MAFVRSGFFIMWFRLRRQCATETLRFEALLESQRAQVATFQDRYGGIMDEERELLRLKIEQEELHRQVDGLKDDYRGKRKVFDALLKEVAVYDERLAFAELGIYEPHFDFDDTEVFKEQIKAVRASQKQMVSEKTATHCPADWTVEGSKAKGQTMVNRQTRLTMRAFNNECEAAIANTRWNNVVAMERRVLAAAKAINKENTSLQLSLSDKYVALKIEELRLTHEYREQQKVEKEERAELARAEREEKKLLAEAAKAEREERKYKALLDKARLEAKRGDTSEELRARIAELEGALNQAHTASERAKAMAEMTKSGFVYVISNVGSFGDNVVKIGLTRRLDPSDRVKELGDASVPFGFDTHAMIYSDEAPALESALHKEFADRRINMANMRKEFFRVELDEVERAVVKLAPDAHFFKDREAQEWHETMARRREALTKQSSPDGAVFPSEL